MTAYQGGKKRIGKKIYEAIIDNIENIDQYDTYIEPFCGMCSVIRHFKNHNKLNLVANDINTDVILLLKKIQSDSNWKPELKCSREQFELYKKSNIHSAERALYGLTCSWGNIFFNNYRCDYRPDINYIERGFKGLTSLRPDILNVNFFNKNYLEYNEIRNAIIYCDPPYKNNNLYSDLFINFDSNLFWIFIKDLNKNELNNIIFVSEISCPLKTKLIKSFNSYTSNSNKTKKYTENLFLILKD